MQIDVFPVSQVPADIAADEDFTCAGWGQCGRSETHDGVWARAVVAQWLGRDLTADEKAVLSAAVDAALAGFFANPTADLRRVPVEAEPTWWTLEDGANLEDAVVAATGMVDPQQGYPSDSIPSGTIWEILIAQGLAQWCPWYNYTADDTTLVELVLQPGLGEPTAQQLEAANAERIELAGADSAYLLVDEGGRSARSTSVVAVAAGNRLTVSGDEAETVATEVLAALLQD